MPTNTYTPLATVTLTGTDSQILFSNIPSTYRDLILVVQQFVSSGETLVYFNGDTGSNYSTVTMRAGAENTTFSATFTAPGIRPQNSVGGANDYFQLQIMDYSATDKQKTTLLRSGNGSTAYTQSHAVRWSNTAAITSIRCDGNYTAGSMFSLYGVIA
jgi:hypothetical protein